MYADYLLANKIIIFKFILPWSDVTFIVRSLVYRMHLDDIRKKRDLTLLKKIIIELKSHSINCRNELFTNKLINSAFISEVNLKEGRLCWRDDGKY